MHMEAKNVANTSDIVIKSASMGGFVEGSVGGIHNHHGASGTVAYTSGAEKPILTIHNESHFLGKVNRGDINIVLTSAASDGTKSAVIRYRLGATLTGSSFNPVDTLSTPVLFDVAATALSGGEEQFAIGLAKVDSNLIDLATASIALHPGEFFTLSCESASNSIITASFNWEDTV